MIEEARTTAIDGVDYNVTVCKYESVAEFVNTVEEDGGDGQVAILNAINSAQIQNSLQSPKGIPREFIKAQGADSEKAQEALEAFPGKVYAFRYKGTEGSRRGDGVKQKESQAAVRHVKGAIADMDEADTFTKAELLDLLAAEGKGVSL